jgi:bifunctional non-homologous end joining protein LigD
MDDNAADYEPPPREIRPMLATLGTLPKDDDAWAYEFKWDGIRAIGHVDGGRLRIRSRNGNDLSSSFPELRALGEQFGSRQAIVDGEIVAFDDQGRPRFQRLQPRIHAADAHKAKRLAAEQPVVYVLFDLLYLEGRLLVTLPYLMDAQPSFRRSRFRHPAGQPRAGPRGGPGQAARFAVPCW